MTGALSEVIDELLTDLGGGVGGLLGRTVGWHEEAAPGWGS